MNLVVEILSSKSPVSFLVEFATKNRLDHHFDLICIGDQNFKYRLTFDGYEVIGEGASKKEAKHDSASKLFNQMVKDKHELLENYSKQFVLKRNEVPFTGKIIKDNSVGLLETICKTNHLPIPKFNLVLEEGPQHAKQYTVSCEVGIMIETATHKTKKHAKRFAAAQMREKIMSFEKSAELMIENKAHVPDSFKVLEKVEEIKRKYKKKKTSMKEDFVRYILLFKKIVWPKSDSLNDIMKQYNENSELNIVDPYAVLKKIIHECKINLVEKCIGNQLILNKIMQFCVLGIENINPPVYGSGLDVNLEKSKAIAANELLKNICMLSK